MLGIGAPPPPLPFLLPCSFFGNTRGTPIPANQIPNAPAYYECLAKTAANSGGVTNCQGCLNAAQPSVKPCMACVQTLTLSSSKVAQANALW